MPSRETNPRVVEKLQSFVRAANIAVILVGCLVFIGWILDIGILKSVLPGLVTMKATAALCFILAGAALWLLRTERDGRQSLASTLAGRGCALSVLAIGGLTLSQDILGLDFGIDQMLLHDSSAVETSHPGRMSPATALNFLLVGSALLLLNMETRLIHRAAPFFIIPVFLISLLGLIGYLYNFRSLYKIGTYTSMAVHTAVTFLLLSAAVLAARPDGGLMALFTSDHVGGILSRRLLPAAIVLPVFLGWLRLQGQRVGLFNDEFGLSLLVSLHIILFVALIWATAKSVERTDAERKQAAIVEFSEDAIISRDLDGIIRSWNKGAEQLFGYSAQEVIGRSPFMLIPPECEKDESKILGKIRSGENIEHYETIRVKKDRTRLDVSLRTSPIKDAAGNLIGISIIAHDITERKRAEEEILRAQTFLGSIVENIPDMIFVKDAKDLRFVQFNKAGEELLGHRRQDLIGRNDYDFFPKEEADFFTTNDRTVLENKQLLDIPEEPIETKHRGTRILHTKKIPICNKEGRPQYLLGISEDITERKRAEEALRSTTEFLRALIQTSPLAIINLDPDSNVMSWNRAAEDMLGWSESEVLGKPLPYIPAEKEAEADALWNKAMRSSGLNGIEIRRAKKDGTPIDLEVWSRTFRDAQGVPNSSIGILADITERKRAEERLAKINACFLGFGVSPEKNINRLTALCGELLGATCALYNYLDGQLLRTVGQWQAPPGFNPVDRAIGHICHDVIRQGGNQPMTVRRLQETPYAQTDPNVLPYKLQTYIGMPVKCQDASVGSLCAVFQRDYVPCEADTKLLGIIAAAIGVEEERRLTEEDQKRLLAELAESRGRFEMFFRQTPSAIAITTIKEGRFLDLNRQAEILTGYLRAELIGRTTLEMNLYVDPTERADIVQRINETNLLHDLERKIRTKSGEVRTAVFSLVPIQMGTEPCLLSIAHDITERKRAESLLAGEKRVLEMISSDARLSTVLESIVRLVEEQQPGTLCSILLLDKSGKTLHHGAAPSLPPSYVQAIDGIAIGPTAGSCGTAAFLEKTVIVSDISSDPLWATGRDLALPHGLRACWSMPIFSSDRLVLGTIAQYHRAPTSPADDDLRLVERFCHLAGIAIERAQAEDVLRNANQALRTLSRQLLQVQEDDRRAIARDLHDEIGQSLTAIKLNVERAKRTSERSARDRIMQDCSQITDNVLEQVRNLSLDLHPSILDDLGLAYALKWYADRQAERARLAIQVTTDPSLPRFPPDIEIGCFRIAQEALTNVVRHAKARRATVTLKRVTTGVELSIWDDGIGFVVDAVSPPTAGRTSIGLTSMQERARLLGGEVKITSVHGQGTEVIATLPLTSSAGTPATEASRS